MLQRVVRSAPKDIESPSFPRCNRGIARHIAPEILPPWRPDLLPYTGDLFAFALPAVAAHGRHEQKAGEDYGADRSCENGAHLTSVNPS
jgi:hypothetical protein